MSARKYQLVFLPGLGADGRLLAPQKRVFPHLVVPPWIAPHPGESLPDYGRRMASAIAVERPLVLGGISLGGMLAWEMAGHLQPEALVLVGSCRSPEAVPRMLSWAGTTAGLLPQWLVAGCKGRGLRLANWFNQCPPHYLDLVVQMTRESDPAFFHWAIRALGRWRPSPAPRCRVFQIHGAGDRMISSLRSGAEILVPGAGHLVNLSHPEQVNGLIAQAVVHALSLEPGGSRSSTGAVQD